jgi:hypothetical protein
MSNPAGSWMLEGFPELAPAPEDVPPGEIQKAYEVWLETRRVNPKRAAGRLQADDDRYVAAVRGAHYVDEFSHGWQLMCDFQVIEGDWSVPGRVVFVEMGFMEAPDLPR